MTKNPLINASSAFIYIVLIVTMLSLSPQAIGPDDPVIMPIIMISLFTLSAAAMTYFFILKPFELYLEGDKKAGIGLFIKTILIFAVIVFIMIALLLMTRLIGQ